MVICCGARTRPKAPAPTSHATAARMQLCAYMSRMQTAAFANPLVHACAPTHTDVHLVSVDAHLVFADARLTPADVHAGGDRYARGDHIYMRPLSTLANVAT